MNRFNKGNFDNAIKKKVIETVVNQEITASFTSMFGMVISNNDPLNINRVKVRIPKVDDKFYIGVSQEEGNKVLPWALPISKNFIETPEVRSIVLVQFLNIETPDFGRVYIDCLSDLSKSDLFDIDRLKEEFKTYDNWENAELAINSTIPNVPESKEYQTQSDNIKYNVGIRGKGNNKVLLKKDEIELTQNKGSDESRLSLKQNVILEAADKIDLISKKGNLNKYHPIFHQPLYNYLLEVNGLLRDIIITLNSVPSLSLDSLPNIPSPTAVELIPKLTKLYADLSKLNIDGHSKKININ